MLLQHLFYFIAHETIFRRLLGKAGKVVMLSAKTVVVVVVDDDDDDDDDDVELVAESNCRANCSIYVSVMSLPEAESGADVEPAWKASTRSGCATVEWKISSSTTTLAGRQSTMSLSTAITMQSKR